MSGTWNLLEEKLGQTQIELGKDIIDKKVEEEKHLSEKDKKGRSKFCISIDAGWNNHESRKSYNSDSGHHQMVWKRSGKVVALYCMSKHCSKCEKEMKKLNSREHDDDVYSQNNFRSSIKNMMLSWSSSSWTMIAPPRTSFNGTTTKQKAVKAGLMTSFPGWKKERK
jgi:hypothetical protein